MSGIGDRISCSVETEDAFPRGGRVLVAVSGGVDSMVLLTVLAELAAERRWRLIAAHLDHQLRGRSSTADARFVERYCRRLGIACVCGRRDVRAFAARRKLSVEMAAREVRHRFLAQTARRRRCPVIALAHHADDQAELVLMRLLRGSGSEGLGGMRGLGASPVDPGLRLVRPLLGIRRSEIEAFAREYGVLFREDRTNAGRGPLRNRVRHDLLPLLQRDYQPAVREVLCRTASILSAEADCIRDLAADWLGRRPVPFEELPLAVRRRAVHLEAFRLGVTIDFDACERLVECALEPVVASEGVVLLRTAEGRIEFAKARSLDHRAGARTVALGRRGRVRFGGRAFEWTVTVPGRGGVPGPEPGREAFDAAAVGRRVRLRHWRPGDRYRPIGMNAAVKLQDLFTNRKVPVDERRSRVVAESESGELFWVEGLRIGERFKVVPDTRKRLIWRWSC